MCEIFICADEVTAAEKTARRRERRGMRRLQNEVMAGINQRAFGLCIRAPQHEDKLFTAGGKALNQRIGALLPAAFGMAAWPVALDSQHRVAQQHALACPTVQTAVCTGAHRWGVEIGGDFFKDIP